MVDPDILSTIQIPAALRVVILLAWQTSLPVLTFWKSQHLQDYTWKRFKRMINNFSRIAQGWRSIISPHQETSTGIIYLNRNRQEIKTERERDVAKKRKFKSHVHNNYFTQNMLHNHITCSSSKNIAYAIPNNTLTRVEI